MLYSEFLEETKAKDNAQNYHIFKIFQALYMDSKVSKEDVYKAAKPFLNSEETKELYAEENGIRPEEITTRTVWR
jgi:hypothetical protein